MSSMTSLTLGFHALRDGWEYSFQIVTDFPFQTFLLDYRIVLLGLCTSFYEATSYIYGIEWTPALQNAKSMIIYDPIPLGFCFAGQLVRTNSVLFEVEVFFFISCRDLLVH